MDVVPLDKIPHDDKLTELMSNIPRLMRRLRETDERACLQLTEDMTSMCHAALDKANKTVVVNTEAYRSSGKQPRWSARESSLHVACAICSLSVGPDERSCPMDRLHFHAECCPQNECPFCESQLQLTRGCNMIA